MSKLKKIISFTLCLSIAFANVTEAFAYVGDMGFFGGISEGRRLPKTTDEVMLKAGTSKSSTSQTLEYKEMVFLGGEPSEFVGDITIKSGGDKIDYIKNPTGTYKDSFVVDSTSKTGDTTIKRNITFNVNYYTSGNQIIKDYKATAWTETLSTPSGGYTIDKDASIYDISIIEDHTPGVIYYKGDISSKAVYTDGTTQNLSGTFYGYNSAYSSTETHRLDGTIDFGDGSGQMQYQVRPSVTVDKTIVYGKNEPQLTSFEGNYKEVISNESGLMYDVFITPSKYYYIDKTGSTSIDQFNTFEQLIAPDTTYLKGHFAEFDIKKLFAMSILTGDPKHYKPNQAITRGQYITMLARAIKLDTTKYETVSKSSKTPITIVFPDVSPTREDYKYIMAGYDAGLAIGRQDGHYFPDATLTREEAFVILLRTLGLSQLGLDSTPVTSFVDDGKISGWARKEIYAAQRIGLISGDQDGKVNPKSFVTKAEAAALTNRLVDYMRSDLQKDYGQNIVHFSN